MKGQRGSHSNCAVSLAYRQSGMGWRPDVNQPAAKPRLGIKGDWDPPESPIGATTALTVILTELSCLTDFDAHMVLRHGELPWGVCSRATWSYKMTLHPSIAW